MFWKLGGLFVLTLVLIVGVIPIRTHAILYDPATEPPPARPSVMAMVKAMYLTPGTMAVIAAILAAAIFIGINIVRGEW